jgi:diguanylate cyclase (GGDEF)-like protein
VAAREGLARLSAHRDQPIRLETRLMRADGGAVQVQISASWAGDPWVHPAHLVVVVEDVTERKALEAELVHRSLHDPLTGLPNRLLFQDRLWHALERGRREQTPTSVLIVDLDGFKAINDRHGHGVGDGVLAVIATRLRIAAAPHFVCRLGGDEFVVVMETIDRNLVTFVARHISERLGEPIRDVAEVPVHASASVGIAFGSIINRNAERILADADKALYLAKEAGGGRHAIDESQPAAGEPLRASA